MNHRTFPVIVMVGFVALAGACRNDVPPQPTNGPPTGPATYGPPSSAPVSSDTDTDSSFTVGPATGASSLTAKAGSTGGTDGLAAGGSGTGGSGIAGAGGSGGTIGTGGTMGTGGTRHIGRSERPKVFYIVRN